MKKKVLRGVVSVVMLNEGFTMKERQNQTWLVRFTLKETIGNLAKIVAHTNVYDELKERRNL